MPAIILFVVGFIVGFYVGRDYKIIKNKKND